MMIVGLTGSIGMGKSTTAKMFEEAGIPVFCSDAEVHRLQAKDGAALPLIKKAFPGTVQDGVLDRAALGERVFADAAAKKQLEAIMHPMVAEARVAFIKKAEAEGAAFTVFDVPLLFETGGHTFCDKIVVASASAAVQQERVLARPGMTIEKFGHITASQMPDAEKRAQADYIVETDQGLDQARAQVAHIIADIKGQISSA